MAGVEIAAAKNAASLWCNLALLHQSERVVLQNTTSYSDGAGFSSRFIIYM